MKLSVPGLMFALASATIVAQRATPITPQTPGTSSTGTITMSGCVGGGAGSAPITMMSPTIVPSAMQPGSVAASATPSTTQPATTPPSASSIGAPATGSIAPTGAGATAAGSVGTSGTASVAATASPSVVLPGGTTSLSATGGLSGYRLTGTDMTSWVGRRVQIVGTLAPASATTTANAAAGSASGLQEFRVQSVTPLTGPCPQP